MNWNATIEEILAERKARMGERPSPEDLAALRAGTLPATERERLLEWAGVDPELAGELLDVLHFPDLPPVDDDEGPAEEEEDLERQWRSFRQRFGPIEALGGGDPSGSPRVAPPVVATTTDLASAAVPAMASAPTPVLGRPPLRWVAVFILGALSAWAILEMLHWQARSARWIHGNLPIVELLSQSAGAIRGADVVRVPAEADGVVVTLEAFDVATDPQAVYRLTVRDRDGLAVASLDGLRPGPSGVFVVTFSRALLSRGLAALELHGSQGELVARYELAVELLDGP